MMPFHRIALGALAFALLFGSCDRVNTLQEPEAPASLDFKFGVWNDSAQARSDSLRVDHPFTGSLTVGDTLWVRVRFEGDTGSIRFAKLFLSGKQQLVSLPIFVPVVWTDTGTQQVKFAVFTAFDSYFDSMKVVVTDETPSLRLPSRSGDGTVRIKPDTTTSFSVTVDDDGRVDSIRWDLDGDGLYDTATLARDTLRIRWTIDRILRARNRSMLHVVARDDDRHEVVDSIPLSFLAPPPSLAITGPDTVSVGDTLRFLATANGSAPLEPVIWPDGTTGSSWVLVAPAHDTVIVVRATIRDSLGGTDTTETRVTVILDAPRVVPQDTLHVHAGRPLHLSGGATQRFGSIVRWGWDLDGDGVFGAKDTVSGIDTTWETAGIRHVGLKAFDDDGLTGIGDIVVSVTDSVPNLSFTVPPTAGPRDSVALSATATDPDGDSLVVNWIVDGDTAIGTVRKVAFDSIGLHLVRALVRSFTPAGTLLAEVSRTDSIVVVADPPRLDLGNDSTIAWGGTWKALGATASDSTGSIVSTAWDFDGNGTWDTTLAGWTTPLHRFLADTGRVVVRARVTDDDGNQVIDSLALSLDPNPWNVTLTVPATSARLSDIMVHLNWSDSSAAASSVRWTSNEGLNTLHNPGADADSIALQGKLVDTLRLTATLTSPSGAVTTRTAIVVLDSLRSGPSIGLAAPDTVSWNDTIHIAAQIAGSVTPASVTWWNQTHGLSASVVAPARDTTLVLKARVVDSLGRADSSSKTVVVLRDTPLADAGENLAVHAGRSLHLSGAATQRFGNIVGWQWDLDHDGVFGTSSLSAGIDTTWETVGPRTVVLRVQDDDGNVAFDTLVVNVTDSVPNLAFTVPPTAGPRDSVALSATATDPDGDSLVVNWIVDGDTTIGTDRKVAFDSTGLHLVRALVRSFTPAGTLLAEVSRTDSIVVVADPPRLDLGNDSTIAWGGTWKALGATASDSTGSIVSTEWDFDGNGTWDTTLAGWTTPLHRFLADTGRVVVRSRVTDDDGNQVIDSLALSLDPNPWNVTLTAPATSARLSDIMVHLNWSDSSTAISSVRWTSNEDLNTLHNPGADADSIAVQGKLVDTLRLTATLTSPSGAVTTRTAIVVLDSLRAGPSIVLAAPDTVSWNDTIHIAAQIAGSVTPASVTWWNLTSGLSASVVAPARDTTLVLKARVVDSLGRADSSSKTVVVLRDTPLADAGENLAVHAGRSLHLSGAATQRFGNIVGWRWDLDHDGVFGTSSLSAGIDTTWETVGPRTVVLRVQDDDGNVAFDTLVVNVTDSVPNLAFTVPATATVLDSVDVAATATDADGDSLRISWIVDGDTTSGPSRRVAFVSAGPQVVTTLVRSYTPAGTFLAQAMRSDTVLVTSTISVRIQHADTLWFDTTAYGTPLQADIVSPAGLDSILWSFDGGSSWFPGDLAGFRTWLPSDTGTHVAIVRVVDRFGASDSDTARVVALRDRPAIDLADTTRVFADSPDRVATLVASVRFGSISQVRWTWTDLDGPHQVDQYPEGGTSVTLSLEATFPPGRFPVVATVLDNTGETTLDTTIVVSTGIRVSLSAPDTVATGSNVHVTGSVIAWPTDSALQLSLTFDRASAADSVLDARMPSAGPHTASFGAAFAGSQAFVSKSRSVEGVDDPPQIESFDPTTIAAGAPQDLSFLATRRIGSIRAWVWDLSAATGSDNTLLGSATNANTDAGTLTGVVFAPGSRPVGYGVITDGGDTVWAQRYFDVIGPPLAVDDTLGESRRTGLDIGCEAGTDCDIPAHLVLDNDLSGAGLERSPSLKGSLDGTNIDSNSDGSWIHLPAPVAAGVSTFRYIITNGYLDDTGTVNIRIYERTETAGFDTKSVGVAYAENTTRRMWGPGQYYTWSQVIPLQDPDLYEYAAFYLDVPQEITGALLKTGNTPNAAGQDSVVPAGEDLYAVDPYLSFYLEHGPTDWMKEELEVHDFKLRVGTRRIDNLGIPGHTAWAEYVLPVTFERLVVPSVKPNERSINVNPSYGCDGSVSYQYAMDVDPIQSPHAEDFIRISIQDLASANDGMGFQDGDITATFTDVSGKPIDIPFKRDEFNWIVGTLPSTGGSLLIQYNIKGLLDSKGNPPGQLTMGWVSSGGNTKSTRLTQRPGATYYLDNGCVAR